MQKESESRVIRYRRPFRPDIGMILFFVILLYIVVSVISYVTSRRTEVYLVRTGSLSENAFYRGIALRDERTAVSARAGNVNYYNREGERIPVGGLLYTIDETGELMGYLDTEESQSADAEALAGLRADAIEYMRTFDPASFATVYDFRSGILTNAQKISNKTLLSQLRKAGTSIYRRSSRLSGIVAYSIDSCEEKTFESLTMQDFDTTGYQKTVLENGARVNEGDPVCRIVISENWQVAIHVDSAETAQRLADDGYVLVRFLRTGSEAWASVKSRSDEDGNYYVLLSFTQNMEEFLSDRFIDIEIITEEESGLKIPNSAITRGNFFLVPREYLTTGTGGQTGVLLEVYDDRGNPTTRFVPSAAYSEAGDTVYLSDNVLRAGEILDKRDSLEQFTLGEQAQLVGVYYINKGYPDFRQVEIIYQNEEYAVVKPDAVYGLQEYDYIVLHADSIDFDKGGR